MQENNIFPKMRFIVKRIFCCKNAAKTVFPIAKSQQ